MTDTCHCGKPLHYTDPKIKEQVDDIVARFGRFVEIKLIGGKTYSVDRHYIALHGIKGADLPALGFEEVVKA